MLSGGIVCACDARERADDLFVISLCHLALCAECIRSSSSNSPGSQLWPRTCWAKPSTACTALHAQHSPIHAKHGNVSEHDASALVPRKVPAVHAGVARQRNAPRPRHLQNACMAGPFPSSIALASACTRMSKQQQQPDAHGPS
jgi:hypothetical protein